MGGPGPGSSASSDDIGGLAPVLVGEYGYIYPSANPERSAHQVGGAWVYDPFSGRAEYVPGNRPSYGPQLASNDITTALGAAAEVLQLFSDFITGGGPGTTYHGPDDPMTKEMMNAPGVNLAREIFASSSAPYLHFPAPFGLIRTERGYGRFMRIQVFGFDGLTGATNATRQFVGSYTVTVVRTSHGGTTFFVHNPTSFTSLTYQMGFRSWERGSTQTPMGTTRQLFYWTEGR